MKRIHWALLVAALTPTLVLAQTSGESAPGNMQDMMKAMSTLMSGGTNAAAVVDFRELKALLPTTLKDMKRTNASGEKSGAMGMTIAFAEGTYEAEAGGNITIKITDHGGLSGFMAFAQAGWAASEIDRESDTGFERTTNYGEYKAHEEYDNSNKSGKVEILVAGRFMVEVDGSDVAWEAIQAAAKAVDTTKLSALKPKAATSAQ